MKCLGCRWRKINKEEQYKRQYKKHWCNKNGFKSYEKMRWHTDLKKSIDSIQKHMDSLSDLFSDI